MRVLKGLLCVAATVVLWSLAVTLIKFLSYHFDVATQNWVRYSSASIFLAALLAGRLSELRALLAERSTLLLALLVFSFQTLTVHGLYLTKTTIASLLMRMNVIFTVALSYALFRDEREVMRSWRFALGVALALAGVAGIHCRPEAPVGEAEALGMALVLLGSLMWSLYVVSIKRFLRGRDPLTLTAAVMAVASLMFVPHVVVAGDPARVLAEPLEINAVLVISGILGVGLGNWLNYVAIRELGAVVPSVLRLLIPLLTGAFSYLLLGETLLPSEAAFGSLIVAGCALIIYHTSRVAGSLGGQG